MLPLTNPELPRCSLVSSPHGLKHRVETKTPFLSENKQKLASFCEIFVNFFRKKRKKNFPKFLRKYENRNFRFNPTKSTGPPHTSVQSVLWTRIRKDPELLPDPDP
jgi:hypothetical protein